MKSTTSLSFYYLCTLRTVAMLIKKWWMITRSLFTTDKTGRRSSNYLLVFIKKLAVIRSKENNKLDKFQTTDVLRLETLSP